MDTEYLKGYEDCKQDYDNRIIEHAEQGKPIEIDGKAYWIQTDIEHLKQLMNNSLK